MSDKQIVCSALCRNHLSGFAEPCAEACITGAGVAFDCEHSGEVWGGDAQHVLDALKESVDAARDGAVAAQAAPASTVERLAILLYMFEMDAPDWVTFEQAKGALTCADALGEHCGDCTNAPATCLRCERDRMMERAATLLKAWPAPSQEGASEGEGGDLS